MTMRLLVFADDPAVPTGFGKVSDHVLKPLADSGEYEIHFCGLNYRGDMPDGERYPYHYYMPWLSPLQEAYGVGRMDELLEKVKPDVVWIQNDLPIVRRYYIISKLLANTPTVVSSPVDGDPFPLRYLDGIRQAAVPVVWTQYAREVITRLDPELGARLRLIPLGYNAAEFYPLATNKAEAQQQARLKVPDADPNWFIVLRVDKNHQRKNWPATLRAFARFAADKPEARLWVHTPLRPDYGYDLESLANLYGMGDRLINSEVGITVAQLNTIYNLADVHLSTTAGGGWELSTTEAHAAGTPTIITDYAAMSEIGVPGGLLTPYRAKYTERQNNTEYVLADEDAVVVQLNRLYEDKNLRTWLRQEALYCAPHQTWEAQRVAEQYDQAFRDAVGHAA